MAASHRASPHTQKTGQEKRGFITVLVHGPPSRAKFSYRLRGHQYTHLCYDAGMCHVETLERGSDHGSLFHVCSRSQPDVHGRRGATFWDHFVQRREVYIRHTVTRDRRPDTHSRAEQGTGIRVRRLAHMQRIYTSLQITVHANANRPHAQHRDPRWPVTSATAVCTPASPRGWSLALPQLARLSTWACARYGR